MENDFVDGVSVASTIQLEGGSMFTADAMSTRPATVDDATLVHALYQGTPQYFEIISIPIPSKQEVARELEVAMSDHRRHIELVLAAKDAAFTNGVYDEKTGRQVVGYLDYKLDYPNKGEVMVNLLLVPERLQSRGFGRQAVRNLELRLRGRAKRVLASIYGQNPRAERFWRALGYRFAIDAKPVLEWYAKELRVDL